MKQKILKYIDEATIPAYVVKNDVQEEIQSFPEEIDAVFLLNKYNEYKEKKEKAIKSKKECSSDFCYWGYYQKERTYSFLMECVATFYISFIDLDDIPTVKINKKKSKKLDEIIQKINSKKDGLQEFKPVSYKRQIELLDSILMD